MAPYRFFVVAGVAFAPILIILLLFEATCWQVGESKPLSLVVREVRSASTDSLFMRQYYDQGLYRYKYLSLQEKKPTIVAIGTSRVMQFRAEMFGSQGESFYNGGGMVQHLRDLEEFVEDLNPSTTIRTVILGVEFWWLLDSFAKDAEKSKYFLKEIKRDDALDSVAHASLFQRFVRGSIGLHSGHYPTIQDGLEAYAIRIGIEKQLLGWYARKNNAGFRPDGSFDYGRILTDTYRFHDRELVVERIQTREWGATKGEGLSKQQVNRLLGALAALRTRGIEVISFFPPFASDSLAAWHSSDDYGKAWSEYLNELPSILKRNGFLVVDGSSVDMFGMDNRYMIDGLHAMETYHVALLAHMMESRQGEMKGFPGKGYLLSILRQEETDFWFPKYHIVQ